MQTRKQLTATRGINQNIEQEKDSCKKHNVDKRIAFPKESYGISEDNHTRTKYVIRDKATEVANICNRSQAWGTI